MKIVDDYYNKNSGDIVLESVKVTYTADLDCCQSESNYPDGMQILTFETDDGGGGKFIRMHTGEAGWSICDVSELINIVNDFKKRFAVN